LAHATPYQNVADSAGGRNRRARAKATNDAQQGLEMRQPARSADHASNNLANGQLIFDKIIPRTRLRPGYGQGWRAV
jgi:hypothetical protein